MRRNLPYFVVNSGGVAPARNIEKLALVWAECLEDPTAEAWAWPALTSTERRELAALVLASLVAE